MAVTISNRDYKEYQVLLHNTVRQRKLDSVRGLDNLKYDIDAPMRNLVAMFALLGCEPIWSCCGFDYDGQPMHKTHEYGDVYITLKDLECTNLLVDELIKKKVVFEKTNETDRWETWKVKKAIFLRSDFDYFHKEADYPWAIKSCLHYPELAIFRIKELEKVLFTARSLFKDEVVLSDTNKSYKEAYSSWQYPSLNAWVITPDDIEL